MNALRALLLRMGNAVIRRRRPARGMPPTGGSFSFWPRPLVGSANLNIAAGRDGTGHALSGPIPSAGDPVRPRIPKRQRGTTTMRRLLPFVLAAGLAAAAVAPVAAANNQSGGAAGVIAAVVQVQDTLNNLQVLSGNGNVEIVTVKDSLNNVLQNSRFLNNITILQDFLNQPNCSVIAVCNSLNNVLNNNNVQVADLVAIDVLSGGDLILFTR